MEPYHEQGGRYVGDQTNATACIQMLFLRMLATSCHSAGGRIMLKRHTGCPAMDHELCQYTWQILSPLLVLRAALAD